MKGLEYQSDEDQLKELEVLSLQKKRLRSALITLNNCLNGFWVPLEHTK